MINKSLTNLVSECGKHEEEIKNCQTDEEIETCQKAFINELKLYLFDTNNLIKEVFGVQITPFKNTDGFNALYKGSANNIVKKSKEDFLKEITQLQNSNVYNSLDDEKKALVDNAFYVLRNYYENSLV